MHIIKERHGYDCGEEERVITPARARPASHYLWYHWAHKPRMRELSREEGRPHHCGMHPDGRCTRGWELPEPVSLLDSNKAMN